MTQTDRRSILKSSAVLAACTIPNSISPTLAAESTSHPPDEESCLTPANDFYTVARGKPKPHSLKGEDLVNARMTPESWRLEIETDERVDPPVVKQKPSAQNTFRIADDKALTYDQILKLGKTKSVKFIKAIQCLNIPAPLGQGLWEGIPLCDVLKLCGNLKNVRRIYYWGFHNNDPEQVFQSSLSYSQVFETPPGDLPVFLAYKLNGESISPLRGGPVRMIVPWAYGFKSIKWIQKIYLTNDSRANDTYATQNNDPDSPLKTAAYLKKGYKKKFRADEKPHFSGIVISGVSGLERVEYLVQKVDKSAPPIKNDSPLVQNANWKKASVQSAPTNWDSILPDGTRPDQLMGFDQSGKPNQWPLRFGMTAWNVTAPEKFEPGYYDFRVRAVDLNGFAQPEPRPTPKSGRNEVQAIRFEVVHD